MRDSTDSTPPFSTRDAEAVALAHFGLRCRAEPLPADRDRNFQLRQEGSSGARRWVLKIFQAGEDPALLDCQDQVTERLAQAGLPFAFPRVRPDVRGRRVTLIEGPDGVGYLARLVDWVPGVPMATARPHTVELLQEVGRLMGSVDRALEDFLHPAADREFDWDLRRAGDVVDRLVEYVEDLARRRLVDRFRGMFRERVLPATDALPLSVIHGDGNDYNILVAMSGSDPESLRPLRVSGLLDFGDIVRSWRVGEVAVAAAYGLLGRDDPLAAASGVVQGYQETHPLAERELDVLFPLVVMRLCVSVVQSSHRRRERPENEYLTISEAPAWRALERLATVDPDLARYTLRSACGLTPSPAAAAVVEWLEQNAGAGGPVLDPARGAADPSPKPVDRSVEGAAGSSDTSGRDVQTDHTTLPVGRHDEVRWLPAPPGADPAVERPTVHIGLDLFAPPGTSVIAPLDGMVVDARRGDGTMELLLRHEIDGRGLAFHTRLAGLDPGAEPPSGAVARGDRLGCIGPRQDPHLHIQLVVDPVGHGAGFPGLVAPSRRAVWRALSPDPNLILGLPGVAPAGNGPRTAEILDARRRHLGPALSVSYRRPLHIVRGFMQHLYDATGQAYLDGVNNVAHVGHEHPRVVAALRRQAGILNTNTRYLHQAVVEYARRLAGILPDPLDVCFLVCSGSEANELALRLARAHTGRRAVVVVEGAYHGNTSSLVEMSPYKYHGPGGTGPGPDVYEVPLPDPYRGRYRAPEPDLGARYANHLQDAVTAAADQGRPVAAFFCEPLPGCGGQVVPPPGFLTEAFRHVRDAGGVVVADEVQTGFGRVGGHMWAFEAQGVVPDIVTLGKPMGNGHPVGAVVTTREIAASFDTGMEYFNSFGGNPVSAAVATAVLDVLEEEGLPERARIVGGRLAEGLESLARRHPLVGDVRGMGLFLGVELVLDRDTKVPAGAHAAYVAERMRAHRILISTDGPEANVLKIKPPMAFSEGDADRFLEILDRVLGEDPIQVG